MALTLFNLGITQPLDDNGAIVPAGKITFYATGTLVKKDTFSDADGFHANQNPVELDGQGRAVIFLDNDGAYDIVFNGPDDADDNPGPEIWTLTKVFGAAPVI